MNTPRTTTITIAPHAATEMMEIENLIRYTERAVGLMEIENLFRYPALAVGLKPSAIQGKARLRGLYRIISSKTISPRLRNAKPACAGSDGLFLQSPSALGYPEQRPPARARVVRLPSGIGETPPQVRTPPARTPAETLQPCRGFHALREGLWRLRNKSGIRPCRGANGDCKLNPLHCASRGAEALG